MSKALIVDDVMENLYLLLSLLTGNGYEVTTASNGAEALEHARRSPPDLIISDILMPVMDGFTLCRRWKQDPMLRKIPFVFYTATYTDPKDEQFALSLGADLFIVKPTEPEVFLSMVGSALEKFRAQGCSTAAVAPAVETDYLKEYNETLIRKLEDKLVELENANRILAIRSYAIESSISGIAMADLSGKITYANGSFAAMWGMTADTLCGMCLRDLLLDASIFDDVKTIFREKGNWTGEVEAKRKDGSVFFAQVAAHTVKDRSAIPICLMVSCIDITEHKRMQAELQRTEKLESLDILAGGVAHDFNNLLTGLFGNIQLARMELSSESQAAGCLDKVIRVYERARDLTQQLLTYAKGAIPVMSDVKVDDILRECCFLSLSGSNVRCDIDSGADLWQVNADPSQLSQAFTNILINARQAMQDGGRLSVSMGNRVLDAGMVAQLPAGKYVRIAVRDSGVGIPRELLPRIFDPFFTTKPEGSGLGLTTSYGIIRNHCGHIEVESAPGLGSTFTIWLPSATGGATAEPRRAGLQESLKGNGRILVMDDEKVVREVAARMLKMGGYEVDLASDGEEALEIYRHALSEKPFDAVILDLTVRGGMGGRETAAELHKLDPDAAIVISSGYSSDPGLSKLRECGFITTIPKPYLLHELLGIIKVAMSRVQRPG